MKRYIFFLSLCLLLPTAFVFAQPGSLDSSFSNDGLVKTKISPSGGSAVLSIAVQNDGKIIAAGQTFEGSGYSFGLVRYSSSGIPDNSFGNKGLVTTKFNSLSASIGSIAIQTNGMIVAGGFSTGGALMVRYKKSGALDNSFGIDGKITSDFGGSDEGIYSIVLQSDGKIIAAGGAGGQFAVARYKQNGTRDSTFGINGLVTTGLGHNTTSKGRGVTIQSDGKILIAGYTVDKHGEYNAVLIRYKKNGRLDNHFGNGGIVITDLGSSSDTYTSLIIRPNGKINTAGFIGNIHQENFVLAQYNNDGILDSSFGTNGFTSTDFSNAGDEANALALQADGDIILAGTTQSWEAPHYIKFALARYTQNGTIDSAFGADGKVVPDFGGYGLALNIQFDGKILAGGSSGVYAVVARYNADSSNLQFDKNLTKQQINKSTTISLSPNPVKDVLYLRGMSTNKKSISIISENGSASQHIVTENSSYTINTKQLKAGVYFVKITEGGKTTTLKFLKD